MRAFLFGAAFMAVSGGAPVSAATNITVTGTVSSFAQGDLHIFDRDIVGQRLTLTYTIRDFGNPNYADYVDPFWWLDVCGFGCHEFGGYTIYGQQVESDNWEYPGSTGDGWTAGSYWAPQNVSSTLAIDGHFFAYDDLGKHDPILEIQNDYPSGEWDPNATFSDWLFLAFAGDSFAAQVSFYELSADALSSTNLTTPSSYTLTPEDSAWGSISWYQGNEGHVATNLRFLPDTFTIAPAGTAPAIPEPSTWGLLLAGFGAIGAVMRRRRQHVKSSVVYA